MIMSLSSKMSTILLSSLLLILATATAQLDHEKSTEYFKQKMKICSELEALGVLEDEEEIPEEYKDLVTPEIHEDCRNFLYN